MKKLAFEGINKLLGDKQVSGRSGIQTSPDSVQLLSHV